MPTHNVIMLSCLQTLLNVQGGRQNLFWLRAASLEGIGDVGESEWPGFYEEPYVIWALLDLQGHISAKCQNLAAQYRLCREVSPGFQAAF